jgi:hypothetical protein
VTWVTLALTAGVPLELVQKVTGHKTTDIVLKHYFRPGQEDFRIALEGAMPKLLTNGGKAWGNGTTDHGLRTTDQGWDAEARRAAKEEMRELMSDVKEKGLRERMMKVWERI